MSYDVSFKVKVQGRDRWIHVGNCSANVTWNLREMIEKSTGLPWINEADNGLCVQVMSAIYKGRRQLSLHSMQYKPLESPNGWGTVRGCLRFFQDIIDAWEDLIRYDQELARIAHFWIE